MYGSWCPPNAQQLFFIIFVSFCSTFLHVYDIFLCGALLWYGVWAFCALGRKPHNLLPYKMGTSKCLTAFLGLAFRPPAPSAILFASSPILGHCTQHCQKHAAPCLLCNFCNGCISQAERVPFHLETLVRTLAASQRPNAGLLLEGFIAIAKAWTGTDKGPLDEVSASVLGQGQPQGSAGGRGM